MFLSRISQFSLTETLGISPWIITYLFFPVAVLVIASLLSKIIRSLMQRQFDRGSKDFLFDPTHFRFLKNAVRFIIFLIAFIMIFYAIPELRALGVSMFAGAGILAIIVGFASQAAFANIVSGIFIVMSKPYRVGDYIKINDEHMGTVEDITLRHTVIRNNENRRIIIPNSVINNQTIINSHIVDEKVCSLVEIGISYDSDIDLAIRIMQDEITKHPLSLDNRTEEEIQEGVPRVVVRVMGFGDSSVNLRAYAWASSPLNAFILRTDVNKTIKESFDRRGVEIPFPYRTIVMKNQSDKRK